MIMRMMICDGQVSMSAFYAYLPEVRVRHFNLFINAVPIGIQALQCNGPRRRTDGAIPMEQDWRAPETTCMDGSNRLERNLRYVSSLYKMESPHSRMVI
jgi:hypothetical protein